MGWKASPSKLVASTTVTTGSMTESMAALEGPMRCSPAKKATPGRTVASRTMARIAPQPATVAGRCGPLTQASPVLTTPADAKITAEDWMADTWRMTRLPTMM